MSDFEPPEKRQRMAESGELSAVLLVPSQLMPGLVGKGGNNVRQLEQASGARINCEKTDRGDDRGVEVSGSSANIAEAVRHISEMICNALNLSTTTIKMAVAAAIAPKLVGKQGSCIKQMIATSGANIVIERASDSGPSYSESTRTVTISGSTDSVATAVMLIVEKIDDLERTSGPSRRPSERDYDRRDRPPPPYNFDAPPARDWYGPPMDGGGDRGWGMGGSAGGGMEPYSYSAPQAAYGFDEPRGGGGDYRDGGGYYPLHRDPPPQYVPPRHAAPPVRGDAPVAGAGAGRETTLTIRVPAKFAGQVVGKAGGHIKETIRQCDGLVTITVDRDGGDGDGGDGGGTRTVLIRGPLEAAVRASELIQLRLLTEKGDQLRWVSVAELI